MMVATPLDGAFDAGNGIPIGTEVFTADDEHLGPVVDGGAYELIVQRAWFLVHDYQHDYQIELSDVERDEDSRLVLRITREQVEQERQVE